MLKSGFQGAIFLFIFCFPFLFRKPRRLWGDGLGNVVVGQAGFADDGEADGRDAAQIAERRRDGAHGAARAGGGGIAAHELVGEDHASRAVGDRDIHHLRPRRDDAAEIDRNGRADERLQGEQRQLARVGTGEHGGDGGKKAVFVGIEEPDGVFRVLGQGVKKNEIVRGIGAVGLRLRLGSAEEGDGADGLELGHGAGQAGVDEGRADVPRRAQLQPERQDAILQRLDRAGIAGGEGQRERFVLRALQIGLEEGGGVGLRRDFLRAQYTGLRVAAVFAAVVELQLGAGRACAPPRRPSSRRA